MDTELITQKQFRDMLGISACTFWRLAKKGELPQSLKIGSKKYWRREDIRRWLESKKTKEK